jgi:hypothetical protein
VTGAREMKEGSAVFEYYNIKITSKMNNTHSYSQGSRMGGYQQNLSEPQRLQKEADDFTKKFEREKK